MDDDFGNFFDESQETNAEKLRELFSKINKDGVQMKLAYVSAIKDLFEKAYKYLLSEIIIGNDVGSKKKLWFLEKTLEKITPSVLDTLFKSCKEVEKLYDSTVQMTFDSILNSDSHGYYINGGIPALEQGIRLDMSSVLLEKTDPSRYTQIFKGIDQIVKARFDEHEKVKYEQMMKNTKIDEEFSKHKTAIVYHRLHNIETLPIVTCYFDIVGREKSFTEIIETDDIDMLKEFDSQNSFAMYSSMVFNKCAENFAQRCFKFFYDLITPEERVLEEKFLKHAIKNLNNDPPLNYAGIPFYKTAASAQLVTKGPDEKSIKIHNHSIIYENVFLSAFSSGIKRNDIKSAIEMINFMKELQIVASDITKFGISCTGKDYCGYTSIIVTYLNSNFRS